MKETEVKLDRGNDRIPFWLGALIAWCEENKFDGQLTINFHQGVSQCGKSKITTNAEYMVGFHDDLLK